MFDQSAKKGVGIEQHVVIEEDVIDPHDLCRTQYTVVQFGIALMHRQTDAEVSVVVQIRAGRNDPINEAGLDQRDQGRDAEAGRC